MPLTCHKTQIKPQAMHSKKIHKTQLGPSQYTLSTLVFTEQLQVGGGYFLNTLNDVRLSTMGGKLVQATTTTSSLKTFLRTLSRQ